MQSEKSKVKTVPENYAAVTPWIISPSSEDLIKFIRGAFDAELVPNSIIKNAEGVLIHAVVTIGSARIMLFDSRKGWPSSPSYLNLYVDDINNTYHRALELGATPVTDITVLWFGEKVCRILDPWGNLWWINERIEDVDFTKPDEIARRSTTAEAQKGIAYIQESLDNAMKMQGEFFKTKRV